MTGTDSMDRPAHPPLAGLDPVDLLKQGVAEDTVMDEKPSSFIPPTVVELAPLFLQFDILELVGKGGMGAVYKVRQKDLDRIVALKILPPAIGQSPAFAMRFAREAKALAKLNHPGIVTIHEFGQAAGLYFILMEFVDGVSLRQLMATERISPREALAIVPQICDALQFAHDQGIVHRDIKPENILLDRHGRVKVADFGIAKLVGAEDQGRAGQAAGDAFLTESGNVMGTPQYMAPEQLAHPSTVDHRADIYALGVVFYQMLTGELPDRLLEAPSRKVHIDVRLDEIVLKAMEKDPELRYQQASVMKTRVDDLGAVVGESSKVIQEAPAAKPRSTGNWIAIGCGVFGLAGVVVVVLLATVAFLHFGSARKQAAHRQIEDARAQMQAEQAMRVSEQRREEEDARAQAQAARVPRETPAVPADPAVPNANPVPEPGATPLAISAVDEKKVVDALRWLLQIDEGNYADSYAAAAALVRDNLTAEQWNVTMTTLRKPLGAVTSRSLKKCDEVKSLPGAPDGDYRLMLFNTSFANKREAVETVTFVREPDGVWRAAGYFIR